MQSSKKMVYQVFDTFRPSVSAVSCFASGFHAKMRYGLETESSRRERERERERERGRKIREENRREEKRREGKRREEKRREERERECPGAGGVVRIRGSCFSSVVL